MAAFRKVNSEVATASIAAFKDLESAITMSANRYNHNRSCYFSCSGIPTIQGMQEVIDLVEKQAFSPPSGLSVAYNQHDLNMIPCINLIVKNMTELIMAVDRDNSADAAAATCARTIVRALTIIVNPSATCAHHSHVTTFLNEFRDVINRFVVAVDNVSRQYIVNG